jgi:hypothetical protein
MTTDAADGGIPALPPQGHLKPLQLTEYIADLSRAAARYYAQLYAEPVVEPLAEPLQQFNACSSNSSVRFHPTGRSRCNGSGLHCLPAPDIWTFLHIS